MNRRRAAEARGRWAERAAMVWLTAKGFRMLAHRARTAAGEVDLVARRGGLLVFVEVKARRSISEARDALGPQQRRRIVRAASLWLARQKGLEHCEVRYDLVLLAPWRFPCHAPGAFLAEENGGRDLL